MNVCLHVCVYMCAWFPQWRRNQIPWNWRDRQLWSIMWVLGIEPMPFGRVISALNCWAISLAPLYMLVCVAINWSVFHLWDTTPLRKTNFLSLLEAIVHYLGTGFHYYYPLYARFLSNLSLHRSCICFHNHCEFFCVTTILYLENSFAVVIYCLWLLQSFLSIFCVIEISFRSEHLAV